MEQKEIYNKDPYVIRHAIIGTAAAGAANYAVFFIAPFKLEITGFYEVHQTAGSDGGTVTLQLERLQVAEALDAGDTLLAAALNLKAAADTVQTGVLITSARDSLVLSKGDRLALKDAGTLTAVANVVVIVTYKPIGQGHFRNT